MSLEGTGKAQVKNPSMNPRDKAAGAMAVKGIHLKESNYKWKIRYGPIRLASLATGIVQWIWWIWRCRAYGEGIGRLASHRNEHMYNNYGG